MKLTTEEKLFRRIKALNETLWDHSASHARIQDWLSHFDQATTAERDRLQALYLLSVFSYFNLDLLRELLHSMYRDNIKYPALAAIRRNNADSTDLSLLQKEYERALSTTRFLGVGNPSESGNHLLYLFRQINHLNKNLFIHSHEIFDMSAKGSPLRGGITRLVFIDDLAGSGTQGRRYSEDLLHRIKELNSNIRAEYHVLFGTEAALEKLTTETQFDSVRAVCELDSSFASMSPNSRYFPSHIDGVTVEACTEVAEHYGKQLWPRWPLGYKDAQLLLGFAHNIPNNTLPILWHGGRQGRPWAPLFERHEKILTRLTNDDV
jgi:hypothetical protein